MGVKAEEIFISPVYYINKTAPFFSKEPFPFEFFLKGAEFSKQAEFRIIIASKNEEFYRLLEEDNYNIALGDISSFSIAQDYYSTELSLSIQGDKLVYNLATPVTLGLNDRTFAELVGELYQILQNQLPGEPKTREELNALRKPITDHLYKKYGVEYRDDWRLYNVPKREFLTLPDIFKGMCETSEEH